MTLDLTVTDLFCGAGGSSIGAELAGARLRMAANHWPLAVETHNENFPHADHDCADITQVQPKRYPTTDILIASPECTNHSQAKSKRHRTDLFNPAGDPAAERSRATMWDVVRFAEEHLYSIIVVENVLEVMRWAPIDAWLMAMESYGYRWRIVSLNSMTTYPTPQSRDRWYCVFWRKGNRAPDLDIRPPCWCPSCEAQVEGVQVFKSDDRRAGKYRSQYLYRCSRCSAIANPLVHPAASAIDWSIPCPRIGDRKTPLVAATRRRIEVGIERYGSPDFVRTWSAGEPMPAEGGPLAMFLKNYGGVDEAKYRAHLTDSPLGSITAEGDSHSVVTPPGWIVSTTRTHAEARHWVPRPIDAPLSTLTTQLEHGLAVPPFLLSQYDYSGGHERRVYGPDEPMRTIVADGNHQALVVPLRNNGRARSADDDVMPTIVAGNPNHALVVRNHGDLADAVSMAKPANRAPFGTLTTAGHQSVVILPFTVDYHGNGRPTSVGEPLPTQDTRDRHGLVQPAIEVDDCGFRMLEPHEIGAAMAFPGDYVVRGNKRQRVKLYGNAVTPPSMGTLLQRCVDSLA